MINRSIAPPIQPISNINFITSTQDILPNGIQLNYYKDAVHDVIIFNLYIEAGKWYESNNMEAYYTSKMLKLGTKTKSALQVNAGFELLGSSLKIYAHVHTIQISISTIPKHFKNVMQLLVEVLEEPVFEANELELIIKQDIEHFKNESTKTDAVANRRFQKYLYGAHPYNSEKTEQDFLAIQAPQLALFFEKNYLPHNANLFLFGNINDAIIADCKSILGTIWSNKVNNRICPEYAIQAAPGKYSEALEGAVQTSIRIGWHSVSNEHADMPYVRLLGKILGGYFGSRLMNNIREEKGYTYGIYAGYSPKIKANTFAIQTEVGNHVKEQTLIEIYKEIDILKTTLIPDDELQLVKNYIMSDYLMAYSDLFAISNSIENQVLRKDIIEHYKKTLHAIQTATPELLIGKAQLYLDYQNCIEVCIG